MSPKAHTQDLARLVRSKDPQGLARLVSRLDDVQLGSQLDNLDNHERDRVLGLLPADRRPDVLEHMRHEAATGVIRRLAPEEAARILDELDSDDAVDILGRLDQETLHEILARFDQKEADELEDLLAYDPDSAGGRMSPEVVRVGPDVTVADAIGTVQAIGEEVPDWAFDLYVVDDEQRLLGEVALRSLVTSRADQPIREIMKSDFRSVSTSTDQEEVAELVSRYDLVSVPVLDEQRRLVGIITVDDIVDVLREEATEDMLKMAGAGEALVDTRSFWSAFRVRLPWLATAAVGGVLVAVALSGFEDALRTVPILALFMPVIAGMGGNVGTQSSTIVVRGLAVGYVETSKLGRLLLREAALGVSFGLLYGLAVAVVASWFDSGADPFRLGAVLILGMVGSMSLAAIVGTSAPLLLDSLEIDPAVATGPFVTTAVDIIGLLFYFAMATLILGIG